MYATNPGNKTFPVGASTDSPNPRKYWSVLKNRLKNEGSEVTTNCSQLKMLASDGKMRLRDVMDTKDQLKKVNITDIILINLIWKW